MPSGNSSQRRSAETGHEVVSESRLGRGRSRSSCGRGVENSPLMLACISCIVKSNYSTTRICRRGVMRTGFAYEQENTGVECAAGRDYERFDSKLEDIVWTGLQQARGGSIPDPFRTCLFGAQPADNEWPPLFWLRALPELSLHCAGATAPRTGTSSGNY